MPNLCDNCDSELGHAKSPSNLYTHFCFKCKTCSECNDLITPTDLSWHLKYRDSIEYEGFKHCACLTPEFLLKIENRSVEITQKELDLLNISHLMVRPDINLSEETNIKDAEIRGINWFNDLPSLDDKFLALSRMETLAAAFSVLLKKEPGSKSVKLRLEAASSKRFSEAIAAESKKNGRFIPCSKCKQKFPELEIAAHFKACLGATPKTERKVQSIRRTHFEKACDVMTKYGMTAEEAFRTAKEQFEAQGLEITYSETQSELIAKEGK